MAVRKPVVSITKPKGPKGPKTPPGYTGQAGSAPPPTSSRPTGTRPGGTRAPVAVSRIPPPAAAPPPTPPAPPTPPTTPFKPDAAWWTRQFAADPRYMNTAPGIIGRQQQSAESYGYTIDRSPQGQPYYVSRSTGARKISQQLTPEGTPALDDNGRPIYVDEQNNRYNVGDLDLSITEKKRGEAGYLAGALGGTTAESERRQFQIGDVAAQAGARRSGMRGQAVATEAQGLINALRSLGTRAAGEFAGGQTDLANLYNQIYQTLVETAGSQPGTPPATETPAAPPVETGPQTAPASTGPTTAAGVTVPQAPTTRPKAIQIAGQRVEFPKGINLAGVDVDAIGRRIVGNIRAAGGVGKLRNGQRVGEFRANGKGYRVFYRGGRFVIELIG